MGLIPSTRSDYFGQKYFREFQTLPVEEVFLTSFRRLFKTAIRRGK